MNNSDYYSRPDRYQAAIDITPKPAPALAPSWSPIRAAIILTIAALVVVAVTGALITGAIL